MISQQQNQTADIPQKFINAETGEVDVQRLFDSYRALERKMSQSGTAPASEEERMAILKRMGMPETAEEYEVDTAHGLFEPDQELNRRFHALGLTKEQVQAVYDIAAEKMVPMIVQMAEDFEADKEIEKLIAYFGGEDKWMDMSRQLLGYGRKNLPADVLNALASSSEGVISLYNMMKGKTPTLRTTQDEPGLLNEDALDNMMKDPKYWRDRDPELVKKVTAGFERLYKN